MTSPVGSDVHDVPALRLPVYRRRAPSWRGLPLLCAMVLVALVTLSCGQKLGPIAKSRSQLDRLPPTTDWIRLRGIRDSDVGSLRRFVNLEGLDLHGGYRAVPQRLTEAGFIELATLQLPSLRSVLISCSDLVTDGALQAIASIPTVRSIRLARCGPFGVEGVRAIGQTSQLESLDLRGNIQISDECVPVLSEMRNLKYLGLTATAVTQQGIRELRVRLGESVVDDDQEKWKIAGSPPCR
jgi:hypothetical protein